MIPLNSANPPTYESNPVPLATTENGHLWTDVSIDPSGAFTLQGVPNNTDSVTPTSGNWNLQCASYQYAYDSANGFFRRVNAKSTAFGSMSPSASVFAQLAMNIPLGYDGTFYSRAYLASAVNLALQSGEGCQMVQEPGEWAVFHEPAANAIATITKAAVASKRHVCKGFTVSISAVGAIAGALVVNLRDGASGAGTILWTTRLLAPAGTCVVVSRDNLNIVGSVNTAMTLEFAAAPGATNFENVNMNGITVA